MAGAKGLIFLDAKSAILNEQLYPRVLEGKREPCEITFNDFDDVSFKITVPVETLNICQVHMNMRNIADLKKMGSADLLNRLFPGMEIAPAEGYSYALQFDCDSLADPAKFLDNISMLKRHMAGGPLDNAFTALLENKSGNLPVMVVQYRKTEAMFICPSASKVVVIFQVDFADVTDKAVAKVFLQEFLEAQRTVRTAPRSITLGSDLVSWENVRFDFPTETAGFLSFAVEHRHLTGEGKDKAITLLTGFRNYLHYHIKCSKTYLHMRMRKRVAGWMQVLNRAIPEVEGGEKKTASGKTFNRK